MNSRMVTSAVRPIKNMAMPQMRAQPIRKANIKPIVAIPRANSAGSQIIRFIIRHQSK